MSIEQDNPLPPEPEFTPPSYRVPHAPAGIDPATLRLGLIAAALGGGLVAFLGLWTLSGHHHGQGVPLIEASTSPIRVKPENRGGLQVAGANEDAASGGGEDGGKLAPGAETPQVAALQERVKAAEATTNEDEGEESATGQAAAAPSSAVAKQGTTEEPDEAPQAEPEKTPPALRPQGHATSRKPVTEATHDTVATGHVRGSPLPDTSTPSMPHAAEHAHDMTHNTAVASAAAGATHPAVHATIATGNVHVQLGALDSEVAAQGEWQRLQKRAPDLLNGHTPQISRTEHDGKQFFRLRTGGFADMASATQFCVQLRAKGAVCSIAAF